MLDAAEIRRLTGLRHVTVLALGNRGQFPQSIREDGRLGWPKSEVDSWLVARQDRADEIAADRATAIAAAAERNRSRPGPGRSASRLGSPLEPGRSLAPGRSRAAGRVSRVR